MSAAIFESQPCQKVGMARRTGFHQWLAVQLAVLLITNHYV
jgi:hypothetical protein